MPSCTLLQPNWSQQPAAVLKWFAAMVSYMEASQVERFLIHILSPVYRIVEDDTIRDPQMGKSFSPLPQFVNTQHIHR